MCAIFGILGTKWNSDAVLQARDAMRHRGTDDQGYWESDVSGGRRLGLAHRRLSIRLLQPGSWMRVDESGSIVETRTYWTIGACFQRAERTMSRDEIQAGLMTAVRERLISDVPLGAFLSGGIDSTSIVAIMSRVSPAQPHTFCLDFEEQSYSEGAYAKIAADRFHCAHSNIKVNPADLQKRMSRMFDSMDQPTCDGVNSYFVCQAARSTGITVALSGQGGDEVFAGYPSFRSVPSGMRLGLLPGPLVNSLPDALPDEIVNRPKGLFWFPWDEWMRGALRSEIDLAIGAGSKGIEGTSLNPVGVTDVWRRFLANDPGVSWMQIWTLFVLARWCAKNQVYL